VTIFILFIRMVFYLFRGKLCKLWLRELAWMLRQRRIRVSRRLEKILVEALMLFLPVLVTDPFLDVVFFVLGGGTLE